MSLKKMVKNKEVEEVIVVTQADVRAVVESNPHMKWFIIQTYSGKDAAAKRSIEERLVTTGTKNDVGVIVMAEKKFSELRNGKMKIVKKKLYPSYLYFYAKSVDEDSYFMDESVYSAIQGAANVHGFIGQENASLPKCIRYKAEINKMISQLQNGDEIQSSLKYKVGDSVVIKTGHFEGLTGEISSLNYEKNLVTVEMKMLGTITPVDLSIDNISIE